MLKQFKKFKRLILICTLKPKAFLILFALFFSSLAFAATLSVTWLDGRIPSHNSSSCQSFDGTYTMSLDSTEDFFDVAFSTDGLQVFSANTKMESPKGKGNLSMNRLSKPFDVTSSRRDNNDFSCDVIDSFKVGNLAGDGSQQLGNMVVADEGRKFFFVNTSGKIYRFDLTTPNEFSTATFVQAVTPHSQVHGIALSDDGRKLFTVRWTNETPVVRTYQLPNPYDISSITEIHQTVV